jgi:predicted Zn finger-like uncharacterized protein
LNIACPACGAVYRIDPTRVPSGGALTRCRECDAAFTLAAEDETDRPGQVRKGSPFPAEATGRGEAAEPPDAVEPGEPAAEPPEDVEPGEPGEPAEPVEPSEPAVMDEAGASPPSTAGRVSPAFGVQDPQLRAQRLARALVSDIKAYNRKRWEESRDRGTLRKDFRDEILKSWDDYVEQVGEAMAKRTPYFRDALNDILAEGEPLF